VRARHVVAFAVVIILAYLTGPSVFLSACGGVLLFVAATSPAERALAVLLPLAFRLALAFGAFHFEPPVQIVEIALRDEDDPLSLILQGDVWWARYLVAYPSILATDHWGMRFADAFALYCAAVLPISAMVLLASVRVWRRLTESRAFAVGVGFAVLVAAIASQMNGRLIPAHIGMGFILLALARVVDARRIRLREGLLILVGMVLSHMTSGTGLVAYAVLVAGTLLTVAIGVDRARMLATLWLVSVLFAPLLFGDLIKNLDYYGGGPAAVVAMLDHGPGILLRRVPWTIPLALIAIAALLAGAWRGRARLRAIPRALWPATLAVPVTGVGGLYGFSTLSMALPALLILLMAAAVAWSARARDV